MGFGRKIDHAQQERKSGKNAILAPFNKQRLSKVPIPAKCSKADSNVRQSKSTTSKGLFRHPANKRKYVKIKYCM
jgi:hypothetical protein